MAVFLRCGSPGGRQLCGAIWIADGLQRVVTFVHHHGQEHLDAMGTMAFNSHVPRRRDTIFRLAFMAKPITAVAAMMLVEECRLRLDDPVDGCMVVPQGPAVPGKTARQ